MCETSACDINEVISPPYFSPGKECDNKVIVKLQTTGGAPKAGYLGVTQTTAVQDNQW